MAVQLEVEIIALTSGLQITQPPTVGWMLLQQLLPPALAVPAAYLLIMVGFSLLFVFQRSGANVWKRPKAVPYRGLEESPQLSLCKELRVLELQDLEVCAECASVHGTGAILSCCGGHLS